MATPRIASAGIKACSRRKSRFGCRNCKLRKIKCDETRPGCLKCSKYGVLCNFSFDIPDLQPVSEEQAKHQSAGRYKQRPVQGVIDNAIWTSDGRTSYILDSHDQILFNSFRYRTVHTLGGSEMVNIYEGHMLQKCFTHPFLMHGTLAVAAVHDRYLGLVPSRQRSLRESYHISQCTTLFNKWLSQPIKEEHKDPIWSAAGTLSILIFSSASAGGPEKAWPLGTPDPSDLQWLRLSAGKISLWHAVNPLRQNSVFRSMFETLGGLRQTLPAMGAEGILGEFAELCGINELSSLKTNPYFNVAHALSRLLTLPSDRASLGKTLMVASHMHNKFEALLHSRDPVALLLLLVWYSKARECKWWIDFRAGYEIPAIRRYLQERHSNNAVIQTLLYQYHIWPAS